MEILVTGVAVEGASMARSVQRESAAGAAARVLWEQQYPQLTGWCARAIGDDATAHDIAAEAFVRLLARWRKVERPKPFLYATALNLMRDHWRAVEKQRSLVERVGAAPDGAASPEDWMRDVAAALPHRLCGPVLLHYGADLPVHDVALALGRPSGTVKRQLAEARARLRSLYEGADA